MFNPNASKTRSEYERVENTLAGMTPNPRHFEGSTYPPDDVRKDLKLLDDFKHTPEYKRVGERSDAKLLEQTFTDMVERGDWFGEEDSYGNDPDYLALVTFPTTEVDDVFNHIDVIGMISNETTNHETLPFAIDLTYNTDNDKMSQKFKWKHVYGKKDEAPDEASEFGESFVTKDYFGNDIMLFVFDEFSQVDTADIGIFRKSSHQFNRIFQSLARIQLYHSRIFDSACYIDDNGSRIGGCKRIKSI